jgi:FkbM family methyltransferase
MRHILGRIGWRNLLRELEGDQYGIKSLPQDSIACMLDVGANCGLFTVLARLCHPSMRIRAVEADAATCACLATNCEGLGVEVVNKALGDGRSFNLVDKNERATKGVEFKPSETGVPSARLAELAEGMDPGNLFIKIDCEGGEKYAMETTEDLGILGRCKMVAGELHTAFEMTPADYLAILRAAMPDHYMMVNGVKVASSLWPDAGKDKRVVKFIATRKS